MNYFPLIYQENYKKTYSNYNHNDEILQIMCVEKKTVKYESNRDIIKQYDEKYI